MLYPSFPLNSERAVNRKDKKMRTGAHLEPKQWRGEIKPLEIGKDYGKIFGLDPKKDQHMFYQGGISWKAVSPKGERIADSQKMYNDALDTINTPEISMGRVKA
jgi:hypothetical protein